MAKLFRKAWDQYHKELGMDADLPMYGLDDNDQPPLATFLTSVGSLNAPVRLAVTGRDATLIVKFFVAWLRPVFCPDEDATTETAVYYYKNPNQVGEGWILEHETSQPTVINRVRFFLESDDDHKPDKITGGSLQFIDHQPRGY